MNYWVRLTYSLVLSFALFVVTACSSAPQATPVQVRIDETPASPVQRELQAPASPDSRWTIVPFGKGGIAPARTPIIVTSRPEDHFTPTPGATIILERPTMEPLPTHDTRTPLPPRFPTGVVIEATPFIPPTVPFNSPTVMVTRPPAPTAGMPSASPATPGTPAP